MTTSPGIEAVRKLACMGFRLTVNGKNIKGIYEGTGGPDLDQVRPLLEAVKAHKPEVIHFLKYCCPRCGGVVFVGNECFLCDWTPRTTRGEVWTQAPQGEVVSTCGECAHFLPSHLNPAQGFGRCALAHLSKRPGAYPGKAACSRLEATVGDGTLRLAQ